MTEPTHSRSPPAAGTLVVIGAGFCGVAVAVQLMRRCAPGTTVCLVNESGRMARGLAYGTHSPAHLLNVPAGNMSALPDEPDHFLRFCRQQAPEVQPGDFVSRQIYGDYLESLLAAHEAGPGGSSLQRIVGRVTSLQPADPGAREPAQLHFLDGQVLRADHVVLAFGHFAPRSPLSAEDERDAGDGYVHDPWRADALARIGPDDGVMLVGAGLTSMDVVLSLNAQGHRGPLLSLSRRGLAPVPHRPVGNGPQHVAGASLMSRLGGTLREMVATLRAEARTQALAGTDWRDLMGALRAATPQLWAGLSEADRARFLRHVRPYWEVLRHRCAPQAHAEHEALVAAGRLQRMAGRVEGVRRTQAGLEVAVQRRGGGGVERRTVQAIVNCTGPTADLSRSSSPLVHQLLKDGLLCADRHALGLLVDSRYRVLDKGGLAVPGLNYIGPLLKALHWEATAVPELRDHALRLAQEVSAAPGNDKARQERAL